MVTDVLPQGTTLAPNPTTWSSTGNREPISGGVRIAEVTNPGEANVRTHYVSEELWTKYLLIRKRIHLLWTLVI